MWYLENIPKIVHFYWAGKKLSFLQMMSVYSFWQLNPDWEIQMHTCTDTNNKITWGTKEQEYSDNYEDFSVKLGEIPVKFNYHNFKDYGLSNELTEIHKSDIIRLFLLSRRGGIYCDMDILFIKPIEYMECNIPENKDKDTFVSICHYGHSIGFLMSSKRNEYYKDLYHKAYKIATINTELGYQQVGAPLINKYYREIHTIPGNVYNISMNTVYPYDANHISNMFVGNDLSKITPSTIGVHWYAGHQLAGKYLNDTNGGLTNLHQCVITSLLKDCYSNSIYPIPNEYASKQVFLLGISGVGKTTLAKAYAKKYKVQYHDFDLYFGLVYNGWFSDKNGAEKFLNNLPKTFITECIPLVPKIKNLEERYKAFLEYSKDKDIQIIVIDCSNKIEHADRLAKKNMKLTTLYPDLNVLEFFKSKGLKVDYYDTATV
jgi:hypothetical protein